MFSGPHHTHFPLQLPGAMPGGYRSPCLLILRVTLLAHSLSPVLISVGTIEILSWLQRNYDPGIRVCDEGLALESNSAQALFHLSGCVTLARNLASVCLGFLIRNTGRHLSPPPQVAMRSQQHNAWHVISHQKKSVIFWKWSLEPSYPGFKSQLCHFLTVWRVSVSSPA